MIPEQIVLATDFSPASSAALETAATIARLFKAKIVIAHVFEFVPRHRYNAPVGWMLESIRADMEAQMNAAKASLTQRGIETETRMIEDGSPSVEILNLAQSYRAPLIVIGTHAVAGMDRFLLGSTAETVLREAACPVITVGPHVRPTGAVDARFDRVLFPTDFSDASRKALPFLGSFRKVSDAALRVLHVQTDLEPEKTLDDELFAPVRDELDDSGGSLEGLAAEYVSLHGKDVSQAITNEAERFPADLLILGVRRASAFVSHLAPKTAFQVIAAAPCAVLTISS